MREPCRRPRSDEHNPRLAVLPHEDHVPVALGGAGRRIVAQGSALHDRGHVGRVRASRPAAYARGLALRAIPCAFGRPCTHGPFDALLSNPQRLTPAYSCREHTTTAAKSKVRVSAPALRPTSRPCCMGFAHSNHSRWALPHSPRVTSWPQSSPARVTV